MPTTTKGIPTPSDAIKISALAQAMRDMGIKIDDLLPPGLAGNRLSAGPVPNNSDLNTWIGNARAGFWEIATESAALTMTGLPVQLPGTLLNLPGIGAHLYFPYSQPASLYYRAIVSASGKLWNTWRKILTNADADDLRAEMATAAAAAKWNRGILPNGTDLETWTEIGTRYITTASNASTITPALPEPGAGFFTHRMAGGSRKMTWEPVKSGTIPGGIWTNDKLGSTWTGWYLHTAEPRPLPKAANLDDYRTRAHHGPWFVNTTAEAEALTGGRPPFSGGFYVDIVCWNQVSWQIAYPGGAGNQRTVMHRKYSALTPGVGWSAWTSQGAGTTAPANPVDSSSPQTSRRDMLTQANRMRHGGIIGVGNKTAVGLSFDHGYAKFRDVILPALVRLGLPASLAVNTDGLGAGDFTGISYPQLQDWALRHGIELVNHGRSHSDATTESAMADAILGSLTLLQTNCPKTVIDSYIMAGVSGTAYNEFRSGIADYSQWWKHPAGRIILDNHAVVTSGMLGMAIPLDGRPVQTMDRTGFDYATHATAVQNRITALYGSGMGIQIFNHPDLIDVDGQITAARIVQFLEWLAGERDAGRVEVLTVSGFAWASADTTRRFDLSRNMWKSNAATVALAPLYEWSRGGQWQTVVTCSAAASVTLTARDNTGALNTTATIQIPAGGTARLTFGIPTDAETLTLTAATTAGTLTEHHVYAA